MFGESLIAPPPSIEVTTTDGVLEFINRIEGFKTRCKNLHLCADKNNIHVRLDELLNILTTYQDELAEDYLGIGNSIGPTSLRGIEAKSLDPWEFIKEIKRATEVFYESIPQSTLYKGITSETENLIHSLNKYDYLFELCRHKED